MILVGNLGADPELRYIQPAPYQDLPFSMLIAAHQVVFAADDRRTGGCWRGGCGATNRRHGTGGGNSDG